jgi:hypothetical protein
MSEARIEILEARLEDLKAMIRGRFREARRASAEAFVADLSRTIRRVKKELELERYKMGLFKP